MAGILDRGMDCDGCRSRKLRPWRKPESIDNASETRLLLEERCSLYGQCQAHRIFPRYVTSGQQHVDSLHADCRRSGISDAAFHRELSVQEASRWIEMDTYSMHCEMN